jgi:hypothetical protein
LPDAEYGMPMYRCQCSAATYSRVLVRFDIGPAFSNKHRNKLFW